MNRYRGKTDAELAFIIKDAGEAAECARAMGNVGNEGKYRDQVCDAASERYRRTQGHGKGGMKSRAGAAASQLVLA